MRELKSSEMEYVDGGARIIGAIVVGYIGAAIKIGLDLGQQAAERDNARDAAAN